MNEIVTDAVVLKAMDFKDNDKIITLFSPSLGKVSGVLKGVKKATAKLKFAGEPFCFAEFTLVKKGELATIVNCVEKESFFEIRKDITAFYCGCAVLEIISKIIPENQPNPVLFVSAVKTLMALSSEEYDKIAVLIKFMLTAFQNFGMKLRFDSCSMCGRKNAVHWFFDVESGGAVCSECSQGLPLEENVRKVLYIIDGTDLTRLSSYSCVEVLLKKSLDFLSDVFVRVFGYLKSLPLPAEL